MPNETISVRRGRGAGLTQDQQSRGIRLAYLSQALGMHLSLLIGTSAICPLFIKKLGGSDLQAMLPASMWGLFMLIQLPVSLLVPPARGRQFLLIFAGGSISPFLTGLILDSSWRGASLALGAIVLDIYQIIFLLAGLGLILAMVFLPFIQNIRAAPRPEPLL